jgi:hypothetical protein
MPTSWPWPSLLTLRLRHERVVKVNREADPGLVGAALASKEVLGVLRYMSKLKIPDGKTPREWWLPAGWPCIPWWISSWELAC